MNSNWYSKCKLWLANPNTIKEVCYKFGQKCTCENIVDENDDCLAFDFRHWSTNPSDVRTSFYEHFMMDHGDSFNSTGRTSSKEKTYGSLWRDMNEIINTLMTRLKRFTDSNDEPNATSVVDVNREDALPAGERSGGPVTNDDGGGTERIPCGLSNCVAGFFGDGGTRPPNSRKRLRASQRHEERTDDGVEAVCVSLLNGQDEIIDELRIGLESRVCAGEINAVRQVRDGGRPLVPRTGEPPHPIACAGRSTVRGNDRKKRDARRNADAENRAHDRARFEFDGRVCDLVLRMSELNSTFKRKYSF